MIIRRTLKLSILSSTLTQFHTTLAGAGSSFLTKFLIILNASPLQFAIFSSISTISQLFQPLGALITKRLSRRKNIVIFLILFGCTLPITYGILLLINLPNQKITLFLILFFLSVSLLSIASNIWIGWITDIIPLRFRGRFFSIISQFSMITAIVVGYTFSLFIDHLEKLDINSSQLSITILSQRNISKGFILIFLTAAFFSSLGVYFLSKIPEKEKAIEKEDNIKLFLSPFNDKNYRRYLIYICCWMFAIGIGAPFWQPFMLKKLNMSLFEVQVYNSINIIFSILILRFWGRMIDKYGNKTAMKIIILLGGMNPMVWLFVNKQNYFIIYFEAITSGIMWAGAGLVMTNFVLSISPPEKRQIYSGVSSAFSGIFTMVTMLLSGLFIQTVTTINFKTLEPEQILFGLSGIARWSVLLPLSMVTETHSKSLNNPLSSLFHSKKRRG